MTSEVFMTDGTLVQVGSLASPPAYATISGVMNVTPPSRTRKSTDVYIMDQVGPVTKTGNLESQELSFDLAYDPGDAAHTGLFTALSAKTTKYWRILFPTSPTAKMIFAGIVSAIEFDAASAEGTDPLKVKVTVKLSADYTLTP